MVPGMLLKHDMGFRSTHAALCLLQISTHQPSTASVARRFICWCLFRHTASHSQELYQRRHKPESLIMKDYGKRSHTYPDTDCAYRQLTTIPLRSVSKTLRLLVHGVRFRALAKQEMRFPLRKIEDSLREYGVRPREPGSCYRQPSINL